VFAAVDAAVGLMRFWFFGTSAVFWLLMQRFLCCFRTAAVVVVGVAAFVGFVLCFLGPVWLLDLDFKGVFY
jgi:hypothetical protein